MTMTSNEAHSGESPSATPIYDELQKNWTTYYADVVLARKVDEDINGKEEKDAVSETEEGVDAADGLNDGE
jgi:hypothetical protein